MAANTPVGRLNKWQQEMIVDLATDRVDKKLDKGQAAKLRKIIMESGSKAKAQKAYNEAVKKMASLRTADVYFDLPSSIEKEVDYGKPGEWVTDWVATQRVGVSPSEFKRNWDWEEAGPKGRGKGRWVAYKRASLRTQVTKLAHENPELRPSLLPLLRVAQEGEGEEPSSGSGGGIGGAMIEFLKQEGDKKVKNPDTDRDVKIKSLKGPKGKGLKQRLFKQWEKRQKGKDKPGTPPKGDKAKKVDEALKGVQKGVKEQKPEKKRPLRDMIDRMIDDTLKGLSPKKRKKVLEIALKDVEKDRAKIEREFAEKQKQKKDDKALIEKTLKGLPDDKRKRVLQRALKMAAHQDPEIRAHVVPMLRKAARKENVEVRVDGRVLDIYQLETAPGGNASYPEPMALLGGQWWPLHGYGSPSRMPWVDVPKAAARRMRMAGGYAIDFGAGGLVPTKKIDLKPNTIHYMGASSSPSLIVVTKVTDDVVEFMDDDGRKRREQRWIAEDLIAKGDETWMKQYASYVAKYDSWKDVQPGNKVNPSKFFKDRERGYVVVEAVAPASKFPRGDAWYGAEEYGGVGGIEQDNGTYWYEINTSYGQVEKLKKDKRFKIVKPFKKGRHF